LKGEWRDINPPASGFASSNMPVARSISTAAARALAHRRAMSTLQRRLELASEIESAIESFLAFDKSKARPVQRKSKQI
jgi:hypothetical protein